MRALLPVGLMLAASTGCGSKPPSAELVSWRTTTEELPTSQGTIGPKGESAFVVVRLRGTGTGVYRPDSKDGDMYCLVCADFTLTAPGMVPVPAAVQRNTGSKQFGGNTYRGKPGKQEEVEVAFAVDAKTAARTDLVVLYHDLPPLALDAAKKGK